MPGVSPFLEDAKLLVKGHIGLQRAAVRFHDPCQVIGMDAVKPGREIIPIGDAQQFPQRRAGQHDLAQVRVSGVDATRYTP